MKKKRTPWNKGLSADPKSPNYDERVAKYGVAISKTKQEQVIEGKLTIWNKGLSADPNDPNYDERVAIYGENQSKIKLELFAKGILKPARKGITMLQDQKDKISNTRKEREIVPWNKGLTKVTDPRVAQISKSHIGKTHTDEHNLNHSIAMKKWFVTNIHPNQGNIMTQDQKDKISKTRLERIESGEIIPRRGFTMTDVSKDLMRKKAIQRKGKYPKTNTSIEVMLQEALNEIGISFETDKPLLNVTRVDIFIQPNICIYADGDYWHTLPGKQEKDEQVNQTLIENGYKVYRFWGSEIRENPDKCIRKLLTP